MSNGNVPPDPQRGEIWQVNFHPQKGQEVTKSRPAVVIGEPKLGNWALRIVVPVFTERGHYKKCSWFVWLPASAGNGLEWDGEVDASQVKSLSVDRFGKRSGTVSDEVLQEILDAVVMCLGYEIG
jgi:mRNA interferase MazF